MGELCLRYDVKVIADEIHQDIIFSPNKHLVFTTLDNRFADITITCTAPSKTFNLAGLNHANIFISNNDLRESFKQEYASCGLSQPNIIGLISCEAVYTDGAQWLDELIDYLKGNMDFLVNFLQTNIPKIKLVKPQGTYLAWLDCRELSLSSKDLNDAITNKAKLWLNDGPMFGKGGSGFQRMNVACPRSILQKAALRLSHV